LCALSSRKSDSLIDSNDTQKENKEGGHMSGVNKVIIIGRLGQDPEMKAVGQGATVARLNVATSESWVKDGQKQERTEWHRIVVWGKLAEICGKYLAKGRQVYVEGRLQTRSWEDNGQKKYSTEIVASTVQFLGSAGNEATATKDPAMNQSANGGADFNFSDFGPEPAFNQSEDIPF
jgi:single-strand DNA-binding protein